MNFDAEIAKDMGRLSRDPLAWVRYAFPWGEGQLSGCCGPDTWQREVNPRDRHLTREIVPP